MKNSFLVFSLLLPCLCISDDFSIDKVYRFVFGGSTTESSNVSYSNDFNSVQLYYSSLLHAVPYSPIQDTLNYSSALGSGTSSSHTRPFYRFSDQKYYPVTTADILLFFDLTAARLVYSGFPFPSYVNDNVSSVEVCFTNSSGVVYYNLRSLSIVSSALVSTNTLFRSSVLSSLSSLDISLKMSLQNSLAALDVLNSSHSDYSLLNSFSLDSSYVDGFPFYVRNNPFFDLHFLDPNSTLPDFLSLYDDDSKSSVLGRSLLTQASIPFIRDAILASFLDPSSGGVNDYLASPSLSHSVISSFSSAPVVNPITNALTSVQSSLSSDLSTIHSSVGDLHSSVDLSNTNLSAIGRSLSYSSDNPLLSMFAGDPSSTINSLRQTHTALDDLLNPDNPDSPFNPRNPNFVGAGGGFAGAFTTNNVVKPLSNAVDHAETSINSNLVAGAQNIVSNVVDSAEGLKKLLEKVEEILNNLTNPDPGDGVAASVRIVGPLDMTSARVAVELPWGPHDVFDMDAFSNIVFDVVSSFNPDFVLTNSVDYTPYLEQLISNTAPYRLWTDYESLMNNDWASVCDAALADSFKASISDFDLIGSDFWHYFTYVSGRQACDVHSLANIFTNVLPLVDFINSQDFGSDDQGKSKSMFDVGSEVISSYPSRSAIEDYISQVTNSASAVSASTNELSRLASSTNTVQDLLSRYFLDKGSSLPSSLVFLKLSSPDGGDSKDFEIPLSDRQELWSTLRSSITVVFTLVNLILLPKFLLMVFRLFMRLFNRSLPFLDKQ